MQSDQPVTPFAALDALGLAYQRRRSARGLPYAVLQRPVPHGGAAELSLIIEQGVARLTVHALPLAADGLDLLARGAQLPLGAAYVDPDHGRPELSLGLYLGAATLAADALAAWLDYADAARRWLLAPGVPPPPLPAMSPAPQVAAAAIDIDAALQPYGHRLQTDPDGGRRFEVSLDPGVDAQIRLAAVPASAAADGLTWSWLRVAADFQPRRPRPCTDAEIALLQRLQRWTRAGRFLWEADGGLGAEVLTPRLAADAAPALVWSASQAAAMLQVAARHFGLLPLG